MAYELKINVKKGVVVGGGLANNAYVEVWIDGMLVETTASVPSPPEWNKEVIKEFDTLEPATPIIISFSMYKKRWTSEGFKLVGSAQFPLSDLAEKLNKGPVHKVMNLIARKRNITLSGTLQLILELKGNVPVEDDFSRESLLVRRVSGRITKGGGAISRLADLLVPKTQVSKAEAVNLGFISRFYRAVFHFDNQVFGRFVKFVVLLVWVLVVKYSMELWTDMKDGLGSVEQRVDTVTGMFEQLLQSSRT
jgi:hypothetical protein